MNVSDLNDWAAALWGPGMLRACGQGALAVAVVWGICRLFPRLPSALRAALWWLACLKTLVSISLVGPVQVAVLPADLLPKPATVHSVTTESTFQSAASTIVPVRSESSTGVGEVSLSVAEPISPISLVFCLWLAGVGFILVTTSRVLLSMRRLVKGARPAGELTVVREVGEALGLRRIPTVLISDHAECSLVIGPWRPVVVLCRADQECLSEEEMRALLAHELAHIRRRDLWAGLLPNLARLVFFFNPLVWLACREYDMAREAACDAEALQVSGMPPAAYGRLLLKLGIGPASASPRLSSVAALGAASPYAVHLRQRVQGLRWHQYPRPRWTAPVLLAMVMGVLSLYPVRGVAKSEPPVPPAIVPPATTSLLPLPNRPAEAKPPEPLRQVPRDLRTRAVLPALPARLPQTDLALNTVPTHISTLKKEDTPMLNLAKLRKPKLSVAVTAMALTAAGMSVPVPSATAQGVPPVPPVDPLAPVTPEVPLAPLGPIAPDALQGQDNAQKPRYQYTLKRGDSYMNHTWDKDVATGNQALAKAQAGDCLIVYRNGKRYLITDAATINQIKESYAPVEAIGKQMEAVGKQMEETSKPMEELGKQMEVLGKQMEAIGGQMEEQGKLLEAAYQNNKSETERKAIHDKMRDLQEQMKTPQQAMKALSDKMRDQSGKMRPHSDQMREYGNRMRSAVKEAEAKVFATIDAAFQNNLAVEQKAA